MIQNIKHTIIKTNKFEDDKLSFNINNSDNKVDISFINSIRRNIEENLDGFIIDNIKFIENNTKYFNDFILQRLKMLPYIYSLVSNYDLTKLIIKLNISNDNLFPITITTNDLEFFYEDKLIDNFISYNNILLLSNICPNNTIKFEFNLKKVNINEYTENNINHYPSVKYTCQNVYCFENDHDEINKMIKEKKLLMKKKLLILNYLILFIKKIN